MAFCRKSASNRGEPSRLFLSHLQSGFTLLELLVAVFIIALISGFAVLSLRGANLDRQMEQEVERAGQLFRLAAQEAVTQARPIGVLVAEKSYGFLLAGADAWELEQTGPFRPRDIPRDWRIECECTPPGTLQASGLSDEESAKLTPHFIFYPTGEVEPFDLIWRNAEGVARYRLTVSPVGEVEILQTVDSL